MSFGQTVLDAKLGRGSIQITLRDMLEFVLTVWLAYLVSAFVRFGLREDVLGHVALRLRHQSGRSALFDDTL